MKKLHSLFILSILALTMFVGCQNPTDGTGNGAGTEATEYTITIEATHGTVEFDKTKAKAGETVKLTKLEADDGYTFKTMSIKKENGEDVSELDRKNQSFTMPESDVVITVNFEKKATPTETPTETPTDDNGDGEAEDPVDDKPTDTTPTGTPTDTTSIVDADEATYGFTKTVNYTVVANGQSKTMTGAELIDIAKAKNLIKDTDYTINGTIVLLTVSGAEKFFGKTTEKYSLSVNASEGYLITGGGMKEAGKTITLPITHYDGTDYVTPTATELYLVKVHIKEGETELNIEDVKVENNKITFTMPDKNINVFAEFCEIRYQFWEDGLDYKACVSNSSGNKVMLALCFNRKAYDNLEPVDGKFVLEVVELETGKDMCFTSLCDDYGIGVITTDGLTILESSNKDFVYNPDAPQIN